MVKINHILRIQIRHNTMHIRLDLQLKVKRLLTQHMGGFGFYPPIPLKHQKHCLTAKVKAAMCQLFHMIQVKNIYTE